MHEIAWTASARHADIVLPATITLEREDIGAAGGDPLLVAMHRAVAPYGEARDDYDIFAGLAERLGFARGIHRGPLGAAVARTSLRADPARLAGARRRRARFRRVLGSAANSRCRPQPWDGGIVSRLSPRPRGRDRCRRRAARSRSPRRRSPVSATPTARGIRPGCRRRRRGSPDARASRCSSSPTSRRPGCTASSISAPPASPRRSAGASRCASIRRTPRRAASRDGDIVRLYNDRGACLAGAVLSDALRPASCSCRPAPGTTPKTRRGREPLCVHGNPNVLTRDAGTSRLAQGCTGQLTLVEIEPFRPPAAADQGLRPARSGLPSVPAAAARADRDRRKSAGAGSEISGSRKGMPIFQPFLCPVHDGPAAGRISGAARHRRHDVLAGRARAGLFQRSRSPRATRAAPPSTCATRC